MDTRISAGRVKCLIYKRLEGVSLLWAMPTVLSKFSNSLCRKPLNSSARALLSLQFLLSANLLATDSISFLSVGLVSLGIISLHSLGQAFKSLLQKYLFLGNGKVLTWETETCIRIYTVVELGCIKMSSLSFKTEINVFIGVISTQSKIWCFVFSMGIKKKIPMLSNLKYHLQEMLFTDHIFLFKKKQK